MGTNEQNALAQSSSPYLRSAMRQPVRWREWDDAAFAAAQRENKPILLDIGAVWCHWCHVMDRESYDSPEIAEIINAHFVPIKVDRDERPDVDSRYQTAVAAISGQGGWPLTAFLTPDGKPFYGGTYFPPQDGLGRPSFRKVLLAIAEAFRERRSDVEEEAGKLMHALGHAEGLLGREAAFSPRIVEQMVQSGVSAFDRENGGFGAAPKFPHPPALDVLIDWYERTGEEQVGTVVTRTLEKMARGGIYDQLAGGFHRYSVDDHWRVPHFEKMSYDNSELLKNYVHGYQVTGNLFFARVARDIIRWMDEWLSDREHGGFYASQDADIDLDDDGDHFTWTRGEARAVLDAEEFETACLHFDIGEVGQMHHNHAKNVLCARVPAEEIASRTGRQRDDVERLIASARQKMYAARLQRPIPYVDKTVYVSWNALAISAYLQAARVLPTPTDAKTAFAGDPVGTPTGANAALANPSAKAGEDGSLEQAQHFALRSLDRILSEAWSAPPQQAQLRRLPGTPEERGLLHVVAYADGQRKRDIPGLLDDYAFTALACFDAYESTADLTYFRFGRAIADSMIARFHDAEGGGFFDTETGSDGQHAIGALSARRKPFQDSPTPAGNPAAALALLRLYSLTNLERYREIARKTLEIFAGIAEQFGIYAGTYGLASIWLARPYTQVVVVGDGPLADALYAAAVKPFAINKSVIHVRDEEAAAAYLPPALSDSVPHLPGISHPSNPKAGLPGTPVSHPSNPKASLPGTPAGKGKAVAALCSNFTCQPPVSDADELGKLIHASIRQR
jgi:uncharacterized protein YyaL (SSP411 family)